jgi:hypothetical protein
MTVFARTMTRAATRTTLVLALALLTGGGISAQTPDWDAYSRALRGLPESTFQKKTVSIRGLQLTVVNKIDPGLRDLVDQTRQGANVRTRSLQLGATAADPRIPVMTNSADARQASALAQEIRSQGGEVSASYDTTVWGLVPPAAIDRIAASANLTYISVQNRMEPTQAPGPGGGTEASLKATGVEALQKAGIRGRGVKVGVIDFGFGGYKRLQQTGKVPAPKAVRSFPTSFPFENDSVHGTACAEIIHDMAPEAELYIASADGMEGSVIAAARWLISQGVDIISYSAGSSAKPTDGTSEMDRFVDSTTKEDGVVWIVSAGNSGMVHWSGPNKADAKGFIQTGPKGESGIEMIPQSDVLDITVRWNDWGPDPRHPTSTQDIDAYLVLMPEKSDPVVVAQSDREQAGNGAPVEFIHYERKGIKGQHFVLGLINRHVTRPVDVHVFVFHNAPSDMNPENAAGSVTSPASASYAIGVGAWDVDSNDLADYSSRGPTDDKRMKPEVTAPAGIESAAYNNKAFFGTSASCPHVAGFAALIKQMHPQLKGLSLRDAIMKAVEPKGPPEKGAGYGWIDGRRIPAQDAALPGPPVVPVAPSPGPSPNPLPGPAPAPIAGSAKGTVTLPITWGGSVPVAFLEQLRAPAGQSPEFLVRVITGRDLYKIGDGLKVGFKASETAAYLLFHRASTGEYTLLSPRGGSPASLTAGASYLLPSEEETFQITPPAGTEELILVCSKQPLDLNAAAAAGTLPPGLVVARHYYQITN